MNSLINLLGFGLALYLAISFAIESNIHAAFGWGVAAILWLQAIQRSH